MYIEPCCIDRQLPALIRGSRFCFFQTSGDVTLEKMLNAVSCLATGSDGHVLVLTVAEVDVPMLRTLAHYFRRGWTRALLLLTARSQKELVEGELVGFTDRVHYAADPLVIDGQLAVIGSAVLVVQGAMLGQADFSLSLYSAWLGSDSDVARSALDPAVAKLKTKAVIDHQQQADIARVLAREFL